LVLEEVTPMPTDDVRSAPPGARTVFGRWRVATRINLLVGIGFLALAVLSGLYFGGNVKLGERIDRMIAIQSVAITAATARTAIVELGRLQARLVERGDITVLADYNAASSRATGALRGARILPRTSPPIPRSTQSAMASPNMRRSSARSSATRSRPTPIPLRGVPNQ
jgi:hypothetical protein